jgi:hypothetical protein
MKNQPYVKEYNENGVCTNPIIDSYISNYPNRQQRHKKPKRFMGNGKGISLTIFANKKYYRHRQIITLKDGTKKTIEQYILSN